ncbi:MAG: ATP-binding protein [Candidatus Riflebacteria bacterium]|nr:ATP-binding protein [Candidatus Riflebacteria bacterium]
MKRNIDATLLDWKRDSGRRVLLVRGARQVGKTFSIRELGRTFEHFVEVNFEENRAIHSFFGDSLDPRRLCEKLAVYFSTPIVAGGTLVFFDEIQTCPDALGALRFFHEKMPDLHVVAAGSLLELALSEIPSLGVGRISSLFMYPLTFTEFVRALGEESLVIALHASGPSSPLDEPFHRRLVDHVKTFQLVGGMPAVVRSYVETRNLPGCFVILDDLIVALQDDFAKYRRRAPVSRLGEVFRSIAAQAGGKFKYTGVDFESSGHSLKSALQLLIQAGLAHVVTHSDARGIPLGAQVNPKRFKVLPFDLGIHQRLLGLDLPQFLTASDVELVNRGSLAEVLTGLELIGNQSPRMRPTLHYWHRESRSSNAEVDYVIQRGTDIIPIEVKAGTRGQMQSLRLFMAERNLDHGVRVSLEGFSSYDGIVVVPLYAVHWLARPGALRADA